MCQIIPNTLYPNANPIELQRMHPFKFEVDQTTTEGRQARSVVAPDPGMENCDLCIRSISQYDVNC